MTKYINLLLLCCAIVLCSSQCKKTTNNPATDQLPPITQTGANTFGCLINGNVWLPKGYDGSFLNSRITIDPSYSDGDMTIRTYRLDGDYLVDLSISSDSIRGGGVYPIKSNSSATINFIKYKRDLNSTIVCQVFKGAISGNPNNINGFIKVTRYDLTNRIFSGEFEITFNNTDCGFGDPVKITQGRFDYKL